ncbi:hypothetical protein NPIL_492741 [Nephila pilipes]|uniref:Uncharacterized protein n=1 Tax=Nephila pilipes TaxID=299642 RepID=A0A8X6TEU4_NEPPI|nr:hypothetical protein NPIL_492741 [Nephila pilipes]
MLRTRALTEEVMPLIESLLSNSSDSLMERLSDEEMSIDDLPVVFSFAFQNAENVDFSSDEDLKEQSVSRILKKRDSTKAISIFSLNLGFIESFCIV